MGMKTPGSDPDSDLLINLSQNMHHRGISANTPQPRYSRV
jgi:hypothetical protein